MELAELQVFLTVAVGAQLLAGGRQAAPHAAGRQPGHPAPGGRARRAPVRPLVQGRHAHRGRPRAARLRAAAACGSRRRPSSAVRELRDLQRGRVLIGANEAAVHVAAAAHRRASAQPTRRSRSTCGACRRARSASRCCRAASTSASLTLPPAERGPAVASCIGRRRARDARAPAASRSPGASRSRWRSSGSETVIAHNDPSPARERVLRLFEQQHAPLNIQIALPSLDGIKRAVEMELGVALLPRRCAVAEIAQRAAGRRPRPEVRLPRQLRLVYRQHRRALARRAGVSRGRAKVSSTR